MRITIASCVLLLCACSGAKRTAAGEGTGAAQSRRDGGAAAGQAGATSAGRGGNGQTGGSGGRLGSGGSGGSAQSGGNSGSPGAAAGRGGSAGSAGMGGGAGAAGAGGAGGSGASGCFHAQQIWFEDFESGDYSRWTSHSYCIGCPDGQHWDGNDCQATALSTEQAHGGTHAQRSEVSCAYTANGNVHRGYGGLQWNGDQLVAAYTNSGTGLDAPHGLVTTWWIRLDSDTVFQNGKWLSFFTTEAECDWSGEVLGFGLEDPSSHLEGAHYQPNGGTREDVPGSPALPRHRWVRLTVYVNYQTGSLHLWQDGTILEHMTFKRPLHTICQWHFGLYASGDNDSIVLFEDDFSLWKLDEDWTDLTREPYFDHGVAVCK